MTAYEKELHKLVECDDYQSEYYQQLERLGRLFDDLTGGNASMGVAIAEEVCFRALELVAAACLRCQSGAFGDDDEEFVGVWWYPAPDMTSPFYDWDFQKQNDSYNKLVVDEITRRIGKWIQSQEWAKAWDDYDRETLHEDMVRAVCLLLYSHHGGSSQACEDERSLEYYLFFIPDDNDAKCSLALSCFKDFAITANHFQAELKPFPKGLPIANPETSRERLKNIDWARLSTDIRRIEHFLSYAELPETSVTAMTRAAARRLRTMGRTGGLPPLDVEQLKQDTETAEDNVQTRMDMLADWLASHQTLAEEYTVLREERDILKRQLGLANARLAVLDENHDKKGDESKSFNERIAYFEEQYDCAFRNLSDIMLENSELMDEKRALQTELEQTKASLDEKAQQLAAKKTSDKVKVLQEQLDAANEKFKSEQEAAKDALAEANQSARKKLIDDFISGLRKRCSRKDAVRQEYLLDDLINSTWLCKDLQQAVHQLQEELQTQPSTDERMARAQEKMAEKPTVEIKNSTIQEFYEGQNG